MAAAQSQSMLRELLDKVKLAEKESQSVSKSLLCSIAVYVLNSRDYSKLEYCDATVVLAKYHLWRLIDKTHPARSWGFIQRELARPYEARCMRCGLVITAKKSIATGLGHVCRKRLGVKA